MSEKMYPFLNKQRKKIQLLQFESPSTKTIKKRIQPKQFDSKSSSDYQNMAPSSHGGPANNEKPNSQGKKTKTQ
jgi:hypothetical protein